ncbi:hypothetical protein ACP70R_014077 [Stipagrostis hirtigluma subsp. patula]
MARARRRLQVARLRRQAQAQLLSVGARPPVQSQWVPILHRVAPSTHGNQTSARCSIDGFFFDLST